MSKNYTIESKKKKEFKYKHLNYTERTQIERWRDKNIYNADTAQRKYNYYIHSKGAEIKLGADYELAKYIEDGIKIRKKSPEILINDITKYKLEFKSKVCAKTIRNCIHKKILNLTEKEAIDNLEKKYKRNFYKKFKTITFDNGGEFRCWKDHVINEESNQDLIYIMLIYIAQENEEVTKC